MRYVVNKIVERIRQEIEKSNQESLFLINEFEDISIYAQICKYLSNLAQKYNKSITIKLSKSKWEYFQKKYEGDKNLSIFLKNNWVLKTESMTEYRNQHNSDILVLLGTESEEDSAGSLKDIFSINCSSLVSLLPTYQGTIDYSDLYSKAEMNLSNDDKVVINKLYKDLFEFVNKDICKLSDFVDKYANTLDNVNDLIELFYKTLPDWGLPKRELKTPTYSRIKTCKKNLLRSEYNFISGITFKGVKTSFNKYNSKIEKYENDGKEYSSIWEDWENQTFKSYKEFADGLKNYILGDRSDSLKQKFINLDFTIIESVLDLKIPTESHKKKNGAIRLYGSPLRVFQEAYLITLSKMKNREQEDEINKIIFNFISIDLVSTKEDLLDCWKNICIYTNRIIEEIAKYSYSIDGVDIALDYEPKNIFCVKNELNTIIHAVSLTKKLHKIQFSLLGYNNEERKDNIEFVWQFAPNEQWLFGYNDILKADFLTNSKESFIPLATYDNLTSLIMKKSDEEFFDYLNERVNLDYSCNLLENGAHQDVFFKSSFYQHFVDLGSAFVSYCNEISKNGLYSALSNESGRANQLIKEYNNLGKKIIETRFNENEYFILDLFIHAFNIEKNTLSITDDRDIDCCIVPPWHPASVEKIKHRHLFFMDGCYKLWNSFEASTSQNGKSFESKIQTELDELEELSIFQNAVDIFPARNGIYFGSTNSYGDFSLYAKKDLETESSLRDLVKKESVFDDEFNGRSYSTTTEDSIMIYDVIKNYIRAFPNSKDKLNLVFLNPSDLQPIISAVNKYIKEYQKRFGESECLLINLFILVKPENKGGKSYITYWMNEFFDTDSNIKIKTYLNEWRNVEELDKLLSTNNDIIFAIDLLEVNEYEFINGIDSYKIDNDECYYPIVLRPKPISRTTTKRRIELTQPQFGTATIHTQIIHYRKNMENLPNKNEDYYAVKTVDIDSKIQNYIKDMHKKAYWVVCMDTSMDGMLLKKSENEDYTVIGFSTGKGQYGQYNLTITARNTILNSIEKSFARRLSLMFKWEEKTVLKAADKCMKEASKLDGISVLTASNQKDYNINEFMAYVLTSLREQEKEDNSPLKVIVHLDSYRHWFDKEKDEDSIFDENSNSSRPDFLLLEVKDFKEKISIDATVIECKIATLQNKTSHVDKAIKQVEHGIEVLSRKFNPNSTQLKRRYWYAQLYRALAFAQISFNNASTEFAALSNKLRQIFNGNFEINWCGEILGYWLDMDGNEEIKEELKDSINLFNIPQQRIQKLILGNETSVYYTSQNFDEILDKNNRIIDESYSDDSEILENDDLETLEEIKIDDELDNMFDNNLETTNVKENEQKKEVESNTEEKEIVVDSPNNQQNLDKSQIREEINKPMMNIEDIRVLIGENRSKEKIYWEFGNKQLANRHMLITGTSGQGKTYGIQAMLFELSKYNIFSIIFDYTEGFRLDQIEQKFKESMGNKLSQYIVKVQGVPINPFKCHEMELAGMTMLEKPADVAGRFANILSHVYGFGDQQYAAIFQATRIGIEKYGNKMNMHYFQQELENLKSSNRSAQTVSDKMQPLFWSIEFTNEDDDFDWGKLLYTDDSKINIFQLTMIERKIQIIITELMLWDAWYYTKKYGSKEKPFVVVLDEAQNLSHKSNSPSAAILTEGRKFGWSAWFATQSLKVLSDDEIVRLLQSAVKLYFKPTDEEIIKMSKQLDPTNSSAWISPLKNLKKGQCIVVGDRIRKDGSFGACKPAVTSVISFEERN